MYLGRAGGCCSGCGGGTRLLWRGRRDGLIGGIGGESGCGSSGVWLGLGCVSLGGWTDDAVCLFQEFVGGFGGCRSGCFTDGLAMLR